MAVAQYVRYAGNPRLHIPVGLGRGSAAAIATSMACKPFPVAVHHLAWAAAGIGGTIVIPGRRGPLEVPPSFAAVMESVRDAVGPFDTAAVSTRRQADRPAYLVLAFRDKLPVAFVKIVPFESAGGPSVERQCLAQLSQSTTAPVLVPRLLATGESHEYEWTAMTPLPARPHRPAWRVDAESIARWLQTELGAVLPRTGPSDWVPIHGDFAPWNLRKFLGDGTGLYDFEDARYGPGDADVTFWNLACATLRRRPLQQLVQRSTYQFWEEFLTERLSQQTTPDLDHLLLATLRDASLT